MKKNSTIISLMLLFLALILSCQNEDSNQDKQKDTISSASESSYQQTGQNFANQTQLSLGSALKKAIGEKGIAGAVEFCNIKALLITDSMSQALNANIKRVSDNPRNPANQAREGELFYIDMCKEALAENKELNPYISEDEKTFTGYYPIVTNTLCLNCHGSPKEIGAETLAKLNKLYPDDKAVGYKSNELRGIFVVEIDK